MLKLTIHKMRDRIERQFKNNLFDIVYVKNKATFEKTNLEYCIMPTRDDTLNLVPAPLEEENIERDFIILSSIKIAENIRKEKYTRDATFVNNYDGSDKHCLSYFQYYIRDNMLSMNVYVRSMNFDTNFVFDNQTFVLAYFKVFNAIQIVYPGTQVGYIKINVFSLHRIA